MGQNQGRRAASTGNNDPNGVREARAKHAGVDVGTVLKLFGGVDDALAGLGRDGFGDRGVVEDDGDGCGGEVEVLGKDLQRYRSTCVGDALFSGGHLAPKVLVGFLRQCVTQFGGECFYKKMTLA